METLSHSKNIKWNVKYSENMTCYVWLQWAKEYKIVSTKDFPFLVEYDMIMQEE